MLGLVFAAVFLGSVFSPPLLDDADSTHAEAAREMFVSGDYVTLHVNGVRYLEKAPLPYWLVSASYHLFGIHEFSTRGVSGPEFMPHSLCIPLRAFSYSRES
jgi:4-amino-4-deoxy-L-arabinose transferase-like glycosyltransferase